MLRTNSETAVATMTATVSEDDPVISGQVHGEDIDRGDQLTFSIEGQAAGLDFKEDGSYTFKIERNSARQRESRTNTHESFVFQAGNHLAVR